MDTISLSADEPAADLLPADALADCAHTVLLRDGKRILSYGAAAGYTPLRELIGEWFGVHPSRVVLTNGHLHGLALLCERVLPGRAALVEDPLYDRAEHVLLRAGGSLTRVPVDAGGLVVPELQQLLGMNMRPAMVYVTPSFQNPTGWTTGLAGRRQIVDLVLTQNRLQTEQILLVEDDAYGLTRFEGERLPALFDVSAGAGVYSSSFSATVASGLRVGFFVLPPGLAAGIAAAAAESYITPALLAQATVFELVTRGSFETHLATLRDGLRVRRDALVAALERHLPEATWSHPEGGLFLWLQLPGVPDGREVLRRARVDALVGTRFGAVSSSLRLSFGAAATDELEAAVERIAAALS